MGQNARRACLRVIAAAIAEGAPTAFKPPLILTLMADPASAAAGLMLTAAGHHGGWPVAVGGSSTINNGICLRVNEAGRTHPDAVDVFARWASVGAPIDATAFHKSYDAIRDRLGIAPIEPRSGRHNGPHLLNGWRAYAATSTDPVPACSSTASTELR